MSTSKEVRQISSQIGITSLIPKMRLYEYIDKNSVYKLEKMT